MIFFRQRILIGATIILMMGLFVEAFVVRPNTPRPSTSLFLEDWVADMIDDELYRENHKIEYEKKWMEKNRNHIVHHVNKELNMIDDSPRESLRERVKDRKLARTDPQRYCADRCVSTGNCDVYEDIFQLSPKEVLAFCNDCVLGEEEDECEIPDAFYEFGDLDLSP